MSTNYSTALSHIVLAGTSICCYASSGSIAYARCSFASIMVNSLLGVWRWGNPSYGPDTDQAYKLTTLIQDLVVLPFIVSTLWIQYGYMNEIALGNMIISIIPIVTSVLRDENVSLELVDTIITLNCGVLMFISVTHENYFGMAACLSYMANIWIKRNNESYFDIPTQDLFNYAMCFFSIFALRAVLD